MKTFNARNEFHGLLHKRSWYVLTSVSDKFGQDCCAFLFRHDFALTQVLQLHGLASAKAHRL
jgi:hypothetical protein